MEILTKIKGSYKRQIFNWLVKDIVDTLPLEPKEGGLTIVSMLCHRDVTMYLLAIKSFYRKLRRGRVIIINDGTLSKGDIDLLKEHVKPIEIIQAKSLESSKCPSYISWKKLFCIAQTVKESFTIQLDSDTLTVGEIPDVRRCVDTETSFILGTWENQRIGTMSEACQAVQANSSQHVQMVAERNFDKLPAFQSLRYVRGCSGFDGFARDSFDFRDLENLSQQMFRIIGNKWNEWGSEQTASNIIIANSPRSQVLPYPKYYSYWGSAETADFIHFVGTYRYSGGVYIQEAKKVIDALKSYNT